MEWFIPLAIIYLFLFFHIKRNIIKGIAINIELENKIRLSQDICSLALSLRKKEKIKVRQPLPKILVPFKNNEEKKVLEEISEFIKSEINVKTIELITDSSEILVKKAKANFKLVFFVKYLFFL